MKSLGTGLGFNWCSSIEPSGGSRFHQGPDRGCSRCLMLFGPITLVKLKLMHVPAHASQKNCFVGLHLYQKLRLKCKSTRSLRHYLVQSIMLFI